MVFMNKIHNNYLHINLIKIYILMINAFKIKYIKSNNH